VKGRGFTLFILLRILLDALMCFLAFFLAYELRLQTAYPPLLNPSPFRQYMGMVLIQTLAMLLAFLLSRLYHQKPGTSRFDKYYGIFVAVSIGTVVAMSFTSFVYKNELDYPRLMVAYSWLLTVLLVSVGRGLVDGLERLYRQRTPQNVLIVGSGDIGRMILQSIRQSSKIGYRPIGFVDDEIAGLPVWGPISNLGMVIREHDVDQVIIGLPEAAHDQLLDIISQCDSQHVTIRVFPDLFQIMASPVTIDDLNGVPLLTIRDVALRGWRLTLKRGMDLLISAIGLVFISPLMMLVALLIKLDSPGPVFYAQERVGLDANPFPVIKFRSMRVDAEDKTGPVWATKDDPRRTRLGSLLRKYSLDEVPNLFNVLIGQMSLVGPRPERPVFVEQFKQTVPHYMDRHKEKAGMTGWAQVNGLRGDTSILERTKYDLWYIENWSLLLDIKILVLTAFRFFRDENAY
jgi:exopolysaccharide biosynthesis polyprenyl glycosylphosphotransferase